MDTDHDTSPGSDLRRWVLTPPEGEQSGIEAVLDLSPDGRPTLTVRHGSTTILEPSALGIRATHEDFTTGLAFAGMTQETVQDSYTTVIGKRREHTYTARHATLHFRKGNHGMDLEVRVSSGGVAFRYAMSWTAAVTVCGEASQYRVPGGARAILLPYDNGRHDYETIHIHTTGDAAPAGIYGYPSLFQVGDTWLLITESDIDGTYAGSQLVLNGECGSFQLVLPDPYVTGPSPLTTPWRTMIAGDAAAVVESDLVTSLARPSRLGDTSWVRPGKAAWSWWSDGASPRELAAQRAFVDYASSRRWEYVLVDAGWNGSWVPELVEYAAARNVGIWLWDRWQNLDTEREFRERLGTWSEWGVKGVKIDFSESDGQDRMRWFDAVLAATARHRLMVNFHGGTIPRGTERTWPHFMTAEAVRGAENIKPNRGKEPFPARHYVTLAFTRNVQGPMDFTPVTFSAERVISAGHELALAVLFESGVQHLADGIESYRAHPAAERFLARVPAAWDETRFISGDPADHVALARRDGQEWFVGAGVAGAARMVEVPLAFLGDGDWTADIYREGPGDPHDSIVVEGRQVTGRDRLEVPVAENGGFAAHLHP